MFIRIFLVNKSVCFPKPYTPFFHPKMDIPPRSVWCVWFDPFSTPGWKSPEYFFFSAKKKSLASQINPGITIQTIHTIHSLLLYSFLLYFTK